MYMYSHFLVVHSRDIEYIQVCLCVFVLLIRLACIWTRHEAHKSIGSLVTEDLPEVLSSMLPMDMASK